MSGRTRQPAGECLLSQSHRISSSATASMSCCGICWRRLRCWGPREARCRFAPALSWLSGIGLVVLAFSASFAAIDWILSLEPKFWSSIFPYTQARELVQHRHGDSSCSPRRWPRWPAGERREQMADLAKILLATTIFWAYVEFMQFLIIWEENLKTRSTGISTAELRPWQPAIYVSAILGFFVPFLLLLWAPANAAARVVVAACILDPDQPRRHTWLLVLPDFEPTRLLARCGGDAGAGRRHAAAVRLGPSAYGSRPRLAPIWRGGLWLSPHRSKSRLYQRFAWSLGARWSAVAHCLEGAAAATGVHAGDGARPWLTPRNSSNTILPLRAYRLAAVGRSPPFMSAPWRCLSSRASS